MAKDRCNEDGDIGRGQDAVEGIAALLGGESLQTRRRHVPALPPEVFRALSHLPMECPAENPQAAIAGELGDLPDPQVGLGKQTSHRGEAVSLDVCLRSTTDDGVKLDGDAVVSKTEAPFSRP